MLHTAMYQIQMETKETTRVSYYYAICNMLYAEKREIENKNELNSCLGNNCHTIIFLCPYKTSYVLKEENQHRKNVIFS